MEKFEIDWGKNQFFRNLSCLILPSDKTVGAYFYAGDSDDDDPASVEQPVYARCLRSVKRRFELLGYTLDSCRQLFDDQRTLCFRHAESEKRELLTFDRFAVAIGAVGVTRIGVPGAAENYDFGEYAARCFLTNPEFPTLFMDEYELWRSAGEFLDNMEPYLTLRLLAENPGNLERRVVGATTILLKVGTLSSRTYLSVLGQTVRSWW